MQDEGSKELFLCVLASAQDRSQWPRLSDILHNALNGGTFLSIW